MFRLLVADNPELQAVGADTYPISRSLNRAFNSGFWGG